MARRIEIELTSARPDGSWTWRAAGAREPKGVLDGGLLHAGAKPGDVLRAEADFEIEGITIVSVAAPKPPERPEPNRIEIIGPARQESPGVTTQLVGRSDRRPGDRRRDRDEGRPRRDRDAGRPPAGRDASRPARGTPPGEGERPARPARADRSDRTPRRHGTERRDRPGRPEADPGGEGGSGSGTRPGRPAARRAAGDGAARRERGDRKPSEAAPESRDAERRPRRFTPGHAHRQAILAALAPEERPVAEQVLRGGIPAVRTALHLEREKAIAEGRPAPNTDQLVAMAESLLPRLKAAEWRDRADAAIKAGEEISLRDLRSVVAGAYVARDDESRELAASLREALEQRLAMLKGQWEQEVRHHLDERRLVRALRLAGRPPEPAAHLDPELAQRLSEAAGEAMSPDTTSDRWLALIDAVAASPVRRTVKPAGLPPEPDPELRRVAHQQSGRIPALAALLGVTIPPPPQPTAPRRPAGRPERARRPKGGPRGAGAAPAETDGEPAGVEAGSSTAVTDAEPAARGTEPAARATEPAVTDPEPAAADAEPIASDTEPSATDAEPSDLDATPGDELPAGAAEPAGVEAEVSAVDDASASGQDAPPPTTDADPAGHDSETAVDPPSEDEQRLS